MLIDNKVYISYSKDDDGFANIYSLDLLTNIRKNLTENTNEKIYYYVNIPKDTFVI